MFKTLKKGTEGLAMRRKEEYQLWTKSKKINLTRMTTSISSEAI